MTNSELCEMFNKHIFYEPTTGKLTWRFARQRCRSGGEVGHKKRTGYITINMQQKHYQAHRVIWMMQTGEWPVGVIDHINGNPSDNRWCNLRDVTQAANSQNIVRPAKRSSTGVLGVVERRGRFIATMTHNKKQIYVGSFDTKEAAHAAYVARKREIHEGCTL